MAEPQYPSDIPSITILRKELGFDIRSQRCRQFKEAVQCFRKIFQSSQGLSGCEIIDWKSQKHQDVLHEMANVFLERDGQGETFWPDDETASRHNKLTYSNGKAHIRHVMCQLFWRLNLQNHRNARYNSNKKNTPKKARKGRGLSHDDPVDLDSVRRVVYTGNEVQITRSTRSAAAASFSVDPSSQCGIVIDPALYESQERPTIEKNAKEPERVHQSHSLDVQVPNNQSVFAAMSPTSNPPDIHHPAFCGNIWPSKKRQWTGSASGTRPSSLAKRSRRGPVATDAVRAPPRKREIRNREVCKTPDNCMAIGKSAENPSTPEEFGDNTPEDLGINTGTETINAANASGPSTTYQTRLPITSMTESVIDQDDPDCTSTFVEEVTMQVNGEDNSHSAQEGVNKPQRGAPIAQMSTAQGFGNNVTSLSSEHSTILTVAPVSKHSSAETQSRMEARVNETPQVVSAPKLTVDFVYNVVTRYPKLRTIPWTPDGSFKSKTLSGLVRELPIDLQNARMECLHFNAVILEANAAYDVHDGREDEFARMKRSLTTFIREAVLETPQCRQVLVDIAIEVITDRDADRKSLDGIDLDLKW